MSAAASTSPSPGPWGFKGHTEAGCWVPPWSPPLFLADRPDSQSRLEPTASPAYEQHLSEKSWAANVSFCHQPRVCLFQAVVVCQ